MLTLMEPELGGHVERKQYQPRKPDRRAAVRYGRRRPKARRLGLQVTHVEQWALDKGCFIGESLQDDDTSLPPHKRDGLVRLGTLAYLPLPGGVLLESLDDLGDDLSRAVVCLYLAKHRQDVLATTTIGKRVQKVSDESVRGWRHKAGHVAVEDALKDYKDAVERSIKEHMKIDEFLSYLGSGPLRDADLARTHGVHLRRENWSDRAILDYLELYGYINPSRTVGRWSHEQFKKLWSNDI